MEDHDKIAPRRRGSRWFLIGGLAFAFMLALGVGVLLGTSTGTTQASALTAVSQSGSQSPAVTASAITLGTRIHLMGTHNSDGSITATSIDIG